MFSLNLIKKLCILTAFILPFIHIVYAQKAKAPVMGWSSWNHFRINIDEKLIKEQADAMVEKGLYEAGYRFINVDDGYFGGRDSTGKLFSDNRKFPGGMKALADYIHSKGLKAGIYSDAGKNTCGSIYDKDVRGLGVGLYGHLKEDCDQFFKNWGYDFLKVDWCGGEKMNLNEEAEYRKIIDEVKSIDSNIVFNVCRWKFPGNWVINIADSWRISSDIRPKFSSILNIIDLNANLFKYASAGHYNDMDMLQVGRGMSYDEDKAHFSMWCMLNSPLLAGNDLRNMSKETLEILTNKEVIAINQDNGFKQAQRVLTDGEIEVWVKLLGNGKKKAIAIFNRSSNNISYVLNASKIGLSNNAKLRDLWQHKDLGKLSKNNSFDLPKHSIVLLQIN